MNLPRSVLFLALLVGLAGTAIAQSEFRFSANEPPESAEVAETNIDGEAALDEGDVGSAPSAAPADSSPKPAAKPKPAKKKKKPGNPYKGVYYDNDFTYLNDPCNTEFHLGDRLKQNHIGCATIDVGGEYRLRHHNEVGLRFSDLRGRNDDFLLSRVRVYGDIKLGGFFRAYVEAIDASSFGQRFPPRVIEENHWDALNMFGDVLLYDDSSDGKLWGRVGRQELLYGSQRLISPLDWGNTRRTFDGAKMFYRSQEWDCDAFWTLPVDLLQHVEGDTNFDRPDNSQEFMGLFSTYKGKKDQTFDFYYLRFAEHRAEGTPLNPFSFDVHTLCGRWTGKDGSWLWDFEGGVQFGHYANGGQFAGFAVAGGGYEWSDHCWKPTLWCFYDWASGDNNPNDGVHGTFNQLFPLAHKYFGFMDLVARQNIHDVNFLFTVSPHKKVTFLTWWHIFALDQRRDALYNALGVPIRRDVTGNSGRYVGLELDLLLTYTYSTHLEVSFGFSEFWAGDFVKNTNPAGVSGNAHFYYTQANLKF